MSAVSQSAPARRTRLVLVTGAAAALVLTGCTSREETSSAPSNGAGPAASAASAAPTADGCTLASHVTGDTATLDMGQMCSVMVDGASVMATWTMGSSTLDGNVIVGTAAGTTSGCSFTQQSTLTRM